MIFHEHKTKCIGLRRAMEISKGKLGVFGDFDKAGKKLHLGSALCVGRRVSGVQNEKVFFAFLHL